jgi:hypothetical protein
MRCRVSIDMLPDDVLLAIFDFCAHEDPFTKKEIEAWQSLVHVCRLWRSLVFESPRRLNLRLVCTPGTRVRDTLDVWPALPLVILCDSPTENVDGIIAALERSDRVCQINLKGISSSHLRKVCAAMNGPFPELTDLLIWSYGTVTALPDSSLGGWAPRLRSLWLDHVLFRGLPKLLLSATHLVTLCLCENPHYGYISPEVMVTVLSALTSLRALLLEFISPRSHPDLDPDPESRQPPPLTRSVLPVLTSMKFKGVSEYFDDFVARIDAPRLDYLEITFFNRIVFGTHQFIQFISRTPTLKALEEVHVTFEDRATRIHLSPQTRGYGELNVNILCRHLDRQLSSLEHVCNPSFPPFSTLEDLYIYDSVNWKIDREDYAENIQWLNLLRTFIAAKNLYLSEEIAPRIVPALKELVGGRATETLPALQNIFLEGLQPSGPVQKGIGQFVAARQVASHPIAITDWARGWQEDEDDDDDDDDDD